MRFVLLLDIFICFKIVLRSFVATHQLGVGEPLLSCLGSLIEQNKDYLSIALLLISFYPVYTQIFIIIKILCFKESSMHDYFNSDTQYIPA